MGATGYFTDESTRDVIAKSLTWEEDGSGGRVIDIAVKASVAYVAWERFYSDGRRFIMAVVVNHSRGDGQVIIKHASEDMGPFDHDCPERILNLLSPVELVASGQSLEWAKKWRSECRDTLAKRAAAPSDGAVIRFSHPITFSDGTSAETFILRKRGRQVRFAPESHPDYFVYRISNWKIRDFAVVA